MLRNIKESPLNVLNVWHCIRILFNFPHDILIFLLEIAFDQIRMLHNAPVIMSRQSGVMLEANARIEKLYEDVGVISRFTADIFEGCLGFEVLATTRR